ncbi:VC_2705 family sodium/solute symporter [Roseiflexus castenholzii]|uniref:Na+/solute symporter n=1 Tax=Roseiflexus castenholzii (strain DSM 13941 / HLO8) TaxID=383372 RepID=A7NG96_ROSCS|nr:VC_2705 family sodium/solute symporter [Roseiflexus castenholzii]ABU56483.1 Na+/solute symporter [Roseiflexus castenholzii DSM 13941]
MFWLAMIAIALMLLTLLFPQLERRDEDRRRSPMPHIPRRQHEQRNLPAVTILETRQTASMSPTEQSAYWSSNLRLITIVLLLWAGGAFLPALLAPVLNPIRVLTGFPLGYILSAQGAPLLFLVLTALYTAIMTRRDRRFGGRVVQGMPVLSDTALPVVLVMTGGALIVIADIVFSLPLTLIGWGAIGLTIAIYAAIGIRSRTGDLDEYYVAGRRIPALFNGLAISADWMSAATFISLAGTLWMLGYEGLAYIIGWTGGYVLLALLLAPYLRKFGQSTIPEFIGARYASTTARLVAAIVTVIVSFTYLTAQVSGIGLIMGRFLGVNYLFGVAIGLGAVLFCSYLGGMRAITWTQVAQAIVIVVTYLTPAALLSLKDTGIVLPQVMYGAAFDVIAELERAQRIATSYAEPFNDWSVWQYLALATCLMCGTAGLPHILVRFYTTPSVVHARRSVAWALLFIMLVYLTIPAYAAFSRWEILAHVVGRPVRALPQWAVNWGNAGLLSITDLTTLEGRRVAELPAWAAVALESGALQFADANGDGRVQLNELSGRMVTPSATDGILQYSELKISPDLVVVSTPEIVGLPGAVAALVIAGGLAAALSTADGLLIVITSSVALDIYQSLNRRAAVRTLLSIGRITLFLSAALAAVTALRQLGIIVELVAWAFSIAAATMFPVLTLGIFWRRANRQGAIAGMIVGLFAIVGAILVNWLSPATTILGISGPATGIFGMVASFITTVVVSWLTPPPSPATQTLIDALRRP